MNLWGQSSSVADTVAPCLGLLRWPTESCVHVSEGVGDELILFVSVSTYSNINGCQCTPKTIETHQHVHVGLHQSQALQKNVARYRCGWECYSVGSVLMSWVDCWLKHCHPGWKACPLPCRCDSIINFLPIFLILIIMHCWIYSTFIFALLIYPNLAILLCWPIPKSSWDCYWY